MKKLAFLLTVSVLVAQSVAAAPPSTYTNNDSETSFYKPGAATTLGSTVVVPLKMHPNTTSGSFGAPVTLGTVTERPVTTTTAKTSATVAPPVTATQVPVVPTPSQPAPASAPAQETAKTSGWHPFSIFGDSDEKPKSAVPATNTVTRPSESAPQKPADPEQILRGKVWKSESACSKEALSGKCVSIDCATHTGGACSDQTGVIWIYR